MRSNAPRASAGSASNHSPCTTRTAARPGRARRGWPAPPRARRPTRRWPRPRRGRRQLGGERQRDRARAGAEVGDAQHAAPSRSRARWRSSARSTTCSVSGRGMSTRPVDHRSSVRNAHARARTAAARRPARRATIASKCAIADLRRRGRRGQHARRLLGDPRAPRSTSQRAAASPTTIEVDATTRCVSQRSSLAELRSGPLVGDQRVDDLVELAGEHLVELVEREPDAVVGDPVLLVVVGADLLASGRRRRPGLARASDSSAACRSCSSLSSRARSTCSALARFWIWLFSSCMATTSAGRLVGDAHRGVGGVHRLPARARRPVHVDLQVVRVDLRRRPPRPRAAR